MAAPARARPTLAELLAVLSLATDLGMGQPMEHVLRQCVIALRLAGRLGLAEADREVVYYTALVAWVGCHVDAYEQAKWFGDDTALKTDFRRTDFATATSKPLFMLRHLGAGRPLTERTRLGLTFLGEGRKAAEDMLDNHWMAADGLAAQLGLDQRVRDSVEQTFERWDGKGVPKGARGEEIHLAHSGWASRPPGSSGWPAWCMTSDGSACPTPSGTSRAR
jgi:HD domain